MVSDVGPSGLLPSGWIPTTGVDPLDEDAILKISGCRPKGEVEQRIKVFGAPKEADGLGCR